MINQEKGRPPAAQIKTLNASDYTQIACKINALLNLLALHDMAMFAVLAIVL
jgi:hypothetical protein